ncbi:MAG: Smr/MutS family protein [Kiritimatiellae bacterium]|nr:Smr/MutS family protein [Kiritimatiellia bacterium]
MKRGRGLVEYDLHPRGTNVDMALAQLERIVSCARASGPSLFAVITGYGSSGGTSLIKRSVLEACRRYKTQNHIRGFLDGEFAGDVFSAECLAFPDSSQIPPPYRRSPNPGIVFIAV